MDFIVLNKSHFNKDNVYVGEIDVTDYPGYINIDGNLGTIFFPKDIRAKQIMVSKGTWITVGGEISAENEIRFLGGIDTRYETKFHQFIDGKVVEIDGKKYKLVAE